MAGWISSGLGALWSEEAPTEEAALSRNELSGEGEDLYQAAASAGAEGHMPPGGTRRLGQRIRTWLSKVRSWIQNHLPPRRQDRHLKAIEDLQKDVGDLQKDMGEVKTRISGLEAGQARIEGEVSELKAGVSELRDGQAELRDGVNELLRFNREGVGKELHFLCIQWVERDLPQFWPGRMRGCPGAPGPNWVPRLHPSRDVWHDGKNDKDWPYYRKQFKIPDTVEARPMQADLLTRMEYEPPEGEKRPFLVLGEAAPKADMDDINRLLKRRAVLHEAGMEDTPIVLCLFSQYAIDDQYMQERIDEHTILHLHRGAGGSKFYYWQDEAFSRMRRVLGWEQDET